jgi:hypothetical protein
VAEVRAPLLFAVVVASACAPDDFDCPRTLRPPAAAGLVAVVGVESRLAFTSPLSTCVSDVLRARAEVFDAENRPVAATLGQLSRDSGAHARVELSFRPTTPGVYLLRVSFEPSLGVHQVLLPVAEVARERTTASPVSWSRADCHGGLWPVDGDTVACERRDAGVIEVLPREGGLTAFEGAFLVAADEVLWSLTPSGTLERRAWRDGGLELTAATPGFLLADTASLHAPTFAGRWRANGRFAVVTGETSLTVHETTRSYSPPPDFAAPHADGGAWFFWADRTPCLEQGCLRPQGRAGVEAGYRWDTPPLRVLDASDAQVGRTFDGVRTEALAPPAEGFARLPPRVSPASVGGPSWRVFGVVQDGVVRFVALEDVEPLRFGLRFAIAARADGGVALLGW